MNLVADIERIKFQEQTLQFDAFAAAQAWELGAWLREAALDRRVALAIEVQVAGLVLFAAVTDGATAGMQDWIRRKRNTVMRFGKSSYAVGREIELAGTTLEARQGLSLADYASHGGGFPLRLRGTGLVGSVVVSGLPQREDHALVVAALAELLGIPHREVALED